jgi:hypothetical protein
MSNRRAPDGFNIKGNMYPSGSIATEIIMAEYIAELEAMLLCYSCDGTGGIPSNICGTCEGTGISPPNIPRDTEEKV